VGQRLAFANHFARGVFHRRTIAVVQDALDEIARRQEILQALLVLDADRFAAKLIGDAECGNVGFAL